MRRNIPVEKSTLQGDMMVVVDVKSNDDDEYKSYSFKTDQNSPSIIKKVAIKQGEQ